jgi:hypothetical protein
VTKFFLKIAFNFFHEVRGTVPVQETCCPAGRRWVMFLRDHVPEAIRMDGGSSSHS